MSIEGGHFMGLNIFQKRLLLENIEKLKPDFHCFTLRFQQNLVNQPLSIRCPSPQSLSEKSFILYCALERTIYHLDDLPTVIPFIEHHANNLGFLQINEQDIECLSNAFYQTVKETMKNDFSPLLEKAWQNAIHIFVSVVSRYLFARTNVVAINQQFHKQKNSL